MKPLTFYILLIAIFFSCKKENELSPEKAFTLGFLNEISAENIKNTMGWLQGMNTRFAIADNHREVSQKIKNKFIALGYEVEVDSFQLNNNWNGKYYQTWQYNVIATISGNVHPDSICILGAHYDSYTADQPFTIAPGADDNASGIAALMEIARIFKAKSFQPKNTIRFIAFGSEEFMAMGSLDYCSKCVQKGDKIKFMLNNDMIGNGPTNKSDWTLNILDYPDSQQLRKEAEKVSSEFTSLKTVNDNKYSHYSDSYSFYQNGYKAIFFMSYTNYDEYMHSANDVLTNCNTDICKEIAKISCAILVEYNK